MTTPDAQASRGMARSQSRSRSGTEPRPATSDATSDAFPDALPGIVLAGGSGQRLGGVDKASLRVQGTTLVDRALAALRKCDPVVVVGPEASVPPGVARTSEHPPGGGPAAGLVAGLAALTDEEHHHEHRGQPSGWVAVLAVDMPYVSAATIDRLVVEARGDGAVLIDDGGRRQYLCAVYRRAALRAAADAFGGSHGLSMRQLVADLDLAEVAAVGRESLDIDEPDDLARVDRDARPIALND